MKKILFLRCGVWDEVVEQKGTLPPSKKIMKNYVLYFFFSKIIN